MAGLGNRVERYFRFKSASAITDFIGPSRTLVLIALSPRGRAVRVPVVFAAATLALPALGVFATLALRAALALLVALALFVFAALFAFAAPFGFLGAVVLFAIRLYLQFSRADRRHRP